MGFDGSLELGFCSPQDRMPSRRSVAFSSKSSSAGSRSKLKRWGSKRAECAAVSFCQRFGSSLNLNIRWLARGLVLLTTCLGGLNMTPRRRP